MVRRYEEPIEVRAGDITGHKNTATGSHAPPKDCDVVDCVPDPAPSAFLWRGRLYVVREVIGHWRERRAWWREALNPDEHTAEDTAAHGLDSPVHMDCLEQQVWRVEASPGRLAGTGVYDLGMDGPVRGWRLLRVAD